MPNWQGSDRRQHLPSNWAHLRKQVFRRDGHQCTAKNAVTGERCTEPAEECDHLGDRDDHRLEMLTSLCAWHHAQKSGKQGADAWNKKRQEISNRFRRREDHPSSRTR